MTITISGTTYPTRKPKDLDAVLIATTGCNAAETLGIVSGIPLPGRLAAALHPFLPDDGPLIVELAPAIEQELAKEGNTVVADLKRLYTAVEAPPASGKTEA